MLVKDNERYAVFIDGANLHATSRGLDFDIDFKKLLAFFKSQGNLLRALYYTALDEDSEYSSLRPLMDWLDYNGYQMVTKPAKSFYDDEGRKKIKGNMDIEMAVDILEMCDRLDHAVLMTGDGDFCALVAAVKRRGCKVTVISSTQTQPSMVADNLRRAADVFIDLADLENKVGRARRQYDDDD